MSLRKGTTIISGVGANGFSPTAVVSKSGRISTLSVTDKNGTTNTQINDGENYAYTINSISGTSITLSTDNCYSLSVSANTTFTLPTPTDGKFHQIMVFATITNSPTINWGTSYYFNNVAPVIENGTYNIIYEHDGTNWYVGAIKKGSGS